jgi:hypothetical protein
VLVVESIGIRRMGRPEAESAKRASDRDINRQTTTTRPQRESDIPRTTTRSGAKDALLLQDWVKKTLITEPFDQVADTVVPHDHIPIPSAARGVIAENIDGLLAQGTGSAGRHNFNAKTVGDRNLEVVGLHDSIRPVQVGRDGRQESPSMRLSYAKETLTLPSVRGALHQRLVDGLIDAKGGLLLGPKGAEDRGGNDPLLARGETGLPKAG